MTEQKPMTVGDLTEYIYTCDECGESMTLDLIPTEGSIICEECEAEGLEQQRLGFGHW